MTERRYTSRTNYLIAEARSLNRGELYALHAEVSRLAALERLSDPVWRMNYNAGMASARYRDRPLTRPRDAF